MDALLINQSLKCCGDAVTIFANDPDKFTTRVSAARSQMSLVALVTANEDAGGLQAATNKLLQFKGFLCGFFFFEFISREVNFSSGKYGEGSVEVVSRQRFNPRLSKQI